MTVVTVCVSADEVSYGDCKRQFSELDFLGWAVSSVRRHVCVRAHVRAARPRPWCIPLYTGVRQPSGLPHLEYSAKLRLESTCTGEREEKRKFCWQSQPDSPVCPHHEAQNTDALLRIFLFPRDAVFAEGPILDCWKGHERHRQLPNEPKKAASEIFQKKVIKRTN